MINLRTRFSALHQDHQRIARAAGRVAFFLVLGKMAGSLKEMAVAYRYGVGPEVDAYQFAMTLTTWLPVTLVGVLSVVLIPVLVGLSKQPQSAAQRTFSAEFLGWLLLLGIGLAVLTWCAWPLVLLHSGAALSEQVQDMTRALLWAFVPGVVLTLLAGYYAARLRAHERHVSTLLDSVPAFVTLLWVLAASPEAGIGPLVWGSLFGLFAQTVWLAYLAARADAHSWGPPRLSFRSAHWPLLINAMGIMLLGQIAMSFVGPLDQYAAALVGNNANATMGYATRLLSLLLGIGAASVGRAALPVLADVQSSGDPARARAMALKWSVLMLGVGCAVAIAAWILAPTGVALLFERGAFTDADTQAVAGVLRWGLIQLPFYFGVLVLVQLLASQHRYRVIALIACINFAIKAGLNIILAPALGLAGIMIATGSMYVLSYLCYLWAASRALPGSSSVVNP